MARYKLLTPHYLEMGGPHLLPQLVEAGAIIDTADLPAHFKPTPHMTPLDDDARAALLAVLDGIRSSNVGSAVGVGPMHRLVGGGHEDAPLRDP